MELVVASEIEKSAHKVIRLAPKEHKEAESIANKALKICQRCGYKLYLRDAKLTLARAYLGLKDKEKSQAYIKSAHQKAKDMSYNQAEKEASKLLKELPNIG